MPSHERNHSFFMQTHFVLQSNALGSWLTTPHPSVTLYHIHIAFQDPSSIYTKHRRKRCYAQNTGKWSKITFYLALLLHSPYTPSLSLFQVNASANISFSLPRSLSLVTRSYFLQQLLVISRHSYFQCDSLYIFLISPFHSVAILLSILVEKVNPSYRGGGIVRQDYVSSVNFGPQLSIFIHVHCQRQQASLSGRHAWLSLMHSVSCTTVWIFGIFFAQPSNGLLTSTDWLVELCLPA